jgi:hypothetical protein
MYLKHNEASQPIVSAADVRNIHLSCLDITLSSKRIEMYHRTLVRGKPEQCRCSGLACCAEKKKKCP